MLQGRSGTIAIVFGLIALFVFHKIGTESPLVPWLRTMVEQAGPWAPLVFVLVRSSTYIIAPLSIPLLDITAGVLFGIWQGVALSLAGQTLGGSVNYWIAHVFGRPGIERFAGRRGSAKLDELYEKVHGWQGLLFARLLLANVYDFISYVAGLTRLRYRDYLWVTIVGGIPGTAFGVAVGDIFLTNLPLFFAISFAYGLLITLIILLQQRITTGQWTLPFFYPERQPKREPDSAGS